MTISRSQKILLVAFTLGVSKLIHWKRKIYFKRLNSLLKRNRSGNVQRDRQNILAELDRLPEWTFKSMFRVDRETFEELLKKISPILQEPDDNATEMASRNVKKSKGSTISNRIKLLATLRFSHESLIDFLRRILSRIC